MIAGMSATSPTPVCPTFTLRTHAGEITFTSAVACLADAYRVVDALPHAQRSRFIEDLLITARRRALSQAQIGWLHKIATESIAPHLIPLEGRRLEANAASLLYLLRAALNAGKKHPKITVPVGEGQPNIDVTLREGDARVAGYVSRGKWPNRDVIAKISHAGDIYVVDAHWTPDLGRSFGAACAYPKEILSLHGIATGECCYCDRPLTTKESRTVGYGPICAEKHGLPWGETGAAEIAHEECLRRIHSLRQNINPETATVWSALGCYYDPTHPQYQKRTGD